MDAQSAKYLQVNFVKAFFSNLKFQIKLITYSVFAVLLHDPQYSAGKIAQATWLPNSTLARRGLE